MSRIVHRFTRNVPEWQPRITPVDLAKALFDRPRPDIVGHLVEVSSASLPSGHATRAVATYLTLATLASRRALILGLAVSIVGLVGASRIYLGVHWPSDVIASWILALGWCALCWMKN